MKRVIQEIKKYFVFNKRNLIKYYQSLMYDMHAT